MFRPVCPSAVLCFALILTTAPLSHLHAQQRTEGQDAAADVLQADPKALAAEISLDGLTPLENGPGILVCEPVPQKADADVAAFGAGCGRWLHFQVGGRPEFGRTPIWDDYVRASRELGPKGLRAASADIPTLRRITGATHIAFGTVSGNAGHCSLTFRLRDAVHRKDIGQPVSLKGTTEEVARRLPELEAALTLRLGAKPRSKSAAPNAGDLAAIGRLPLDPFALTSGKDLKSLQRLAEAKPLGRMFYFHWYAVRAPEDTSPLAERLLQGAPGNVLALTDIAWLLSPDVYYYNDDLAKMARRWPKDAALQASLGHLTTNWDGRAVDGMRLLRRAVRLAPDSPTAWYLLSDDLANIASRVRMNRYWSNIPEDRFAFIEKVYRLERQAARRAVRMDPKYAAAWYQLSKADMFDGDDKGADAAYWTALRLQPDDPGLYWWGLQMYQPKWTDNKEGLDRVSRAIVAQAKRSAEPQRFWKRALEMRALGYKIESDQVIQAGIAGARKSLAQAPENTAARRMLSALLQAAGDSEGSVRELKTLSDQHPDDYRWSRDLGEAYYVNRQYDNAIETYRAHMKRFPEDYDVLQRIAAIQHELGRWSDLAATARQGLERWPNMWLFRYYLGVGLLYERKPDEAIAAFEEAARVYSTYYHRTLGDAELGIAYAYEQKQQYDIALQHAEKGVNTVTDIGRGYLAIGRIQEAAGRDDLAVEAYSQAILRTDRSPEAHLRRGKLLWKLGRKEEAREDWQAAIKQAPDSDMAKEAGDLLKQ